MVIHVCGVFQCAIVFYCAYIDILYINFKFHPLLPLFPWCLYVCESSYVAQNYSVHDHACVYTLTTCRYTLYSFLTTHMYTLLTSHSHTHSSPLTITHSSAFTCTHTTHYSHVQFATHRRSVTQVVQDVHLTQDCTNANACTPLWG